MPDFDERVKVLVAADSDSYLKWAAGLFGKDDPDFDSRVVVIRGTAEPSPRQIADALRTSDWDPADVDVVSVAEVRELLEDVEVLVLAVRGAMALVLGEQAVKPLTNRPVVVSGLPGMSIPAKRRGLLYRSYADVFVLHSKAEIEAFTEIAEGLPLLDRFALATLPFTTPGVTVRHDPTGPLVFATQAIVPSSLRARRQLADMLLDFARAHADREVIIKIRNAAGETQTHADNNPLDALIRAQAAEQGLPANLSVQSGAMVDVLDGAAGLLTISSTAALEAVEYGQPVALLDDFGVRKALLNTAFEDSGLMAPLASLGDESSWPTPDPSWMDANYFHPQMENTWRERTLDQVRRRREGTLPAAVYVVDEQFSAHEMLYWSASPLVEADRTPEQVAAVRKEQVRRRIRKVFRAVLALPLRVVKAVLRRVRPSRES